MAELRRHILPDEILELPAIVGRLAERVDALATAQERTERQLEVLTARVDALAVAQERTEQQMATLADRVGDLQLDVGHLKGMMLEERFRNRAPAFLGRFVRRAHALTYEELSGLLDPHIEQGHLDEDQVETITLADAVVRGRRDGEEVYLVVEVSWGVGVEDVNQAVQRAQLLGRIGVRTIPVVAGTWITTDAQQAGASWQVELIISRQALGLRPDRRN